MTMYDTLEVINLTDIQLLRDECLRLTVQNNMMSDARRMDAKEYRRMIEGNGQLIQRIKDRVPNWRDVFPEWVGNE